MKTWLAWAGLFLIAVSLAGWFTLTVPPMVGSVGATVGLFLWMFSLSRGR